MIRRFIQTMVILICINTIGQSQVSIDMGYQQGKYPVFETGLNYTVFWKYSFSLGVGFEDRLDSKTYGYKTGATFYIPIKSNKYYTELYVNGSANWRYYKSYDRSIDFFGPEIGITYHYLFGARSRSLISLCYGYNFIPDGCEDIVNKHLVRLSINTNLRGFFGFFRIGMP